MAVSKRLRFEIFRRDNHTCRYCGQSAPDVKLTVDHVIPEALGGSDEPSNLVTACSDCNSGKTSTTPDNPHVEDVTNDAMRWARAMEKAAELERLKRERVEDYRDQIRHALEDAFVGGELMVHYEPDQGWHLKDDPERKYAWVVRLRDVRTDESRVLYLADTEDEANRKADDRYVSCMPELPRDWDASAASWMAAGVTAADLDEAARVAANARHVGHRAQFRYFCGVIWRMLEERQRVARKLLDNEGDA